MSFRDLRNLTEGLRVLGYPRLISVENFREPNFKLVAEILRWLTVRYDPNADFPVDVDSEGERVTFVKAVARYMATKGGIKLNTKKLYRADGHSVKELLKLVDVLTAALRANTDGAADDETEVDISKFDLTGHADALKNTRMLASQITSRGSTLHELLGDEVELREARADAIARPLDVDEIEAGVRRTITLAQEEIERTKALMDNVGADEANLAQKIEIKQAEIDRNTKRLQSLEGYRPPYMDEYEKYESELKQQYNKYIEEFRNLTYLEDQVGRLQQEDEEQLAHAISHGNTPGNAAGYPHAFGGEGNDFYDARPVDIFQDDGEGEGDSDDEFLQGRPEFGGDIADGGDESSEEDDDDIDDEDEDRHDHGDYFGQGGVEDNFGEEDGSDTDDDF